MVELIRGETVRDSLIGLAKVIGIVVGGLIALILCGFISSQIPWNNVFVDPNAIPTNVQHSTLAADKLTECERSSTYTREGRDSFYPNRMIECLYTAGFEIRYNGEPIRRVVSE